MIRWLDHVALLVQDVDAALPLFRDVLEGEVVADFRRGDMKQRGVQLVMPGGFKLELLQPTEPDSIHHQFLDRRGPGFHHMNFVVEDVPAVIDQLEASGFSVTGVSLEREGRREVFVHPRSGFGTLIQLTERADREHGPTTPSGCPKG